MTTLKAFSEKEHAYDAYQARQNYLRVQASIARRQRELEQAMATPKTRRPTRVARADSVLMPSPCDR